MEGVVEATGVEPVSEKTPTKASTSLAQALISRLRTLPSELTAAANLDLISRARRGPRAR